MPIVLAPAAEAFGWLLLLYLGIKLAQSFATSFDIHVPVIGRPFHSVLRAIENAMVSAWNGFLRPHIRRLVSWFHAVADAIVSFPAAIFLFAAAVVEGFDYLRHTALPTVVHAALAPYAKAINALHAADVALGKSIISAEHRLGQSIDDLRDFVKIDVLARLARGIDRLRNDIYSVAIPEIWKGIHAGDIALERGIDAVHDEAIAAERDVLDLARRLDIPLKLVESLIAAVGIAAALDALQTLGRCSPKLRALCLHDAGAWEDFLIATLAIIAFPGFREMTLMAVNLLEESRGVVQELAES